jgi:hypothetical protein
MKAAEQSFEFRPTQAARSVSSAESAPAVGRDAPLRGFG